MPISAYGVLTKSCSEFFQGLYKVRRSTFKLKGLAFSNSRFEAYFGFFGTEEPRYESSSSCEAIKYVDAVVKAVNSKTFEDVHCR